MTLISNFRRLVYAVVATGLLGALPGALSGAAAQAYPVRPVKLIVPSPPGGSTDVIARLIAQRLGDALKMSVVVENKPGVGFVLGTDFVAKAPADGYTLVVSANPAIAPGPLMRTTMPYDPIKDFTHLALLGSFPNGFVVRADHPAKTMAEFIAMARARPGVLNYSSAGLGYKGSAPAFVDLMSGQLDGKFESLVTATAYVRGGKVRLLSVSGDTRSKTFPAVPALTEVVPGVVGGAWFGISAPARLPANIALRLQNEIQAIVSAPDIQVRLSELGMTPMPLVGEEFLAFIQAENRRWGPLIKAGKITVE